MNTAKTSLRPVAAAHSPTAARSNLNAFMLFIVGFSLAGSGFSLLRINFLGLRVHTYLMVVGAFFPLLAVTRLHLIPSKVLFELTAFASLYFVTTIPGGVDYGEGIKIFAAVATIITMAMLVRSRNDFVAGVLGMCLAVGVLAVKGLESDIGATAGLEVMQETNRNAYSLYALPAILLGSHVLIRGKHDSIIYKVLIGGSILVSCIVILLSLNRSGWLGIGLIIIMMLRARSLKAAVIFTVVGGLVGAILFTVFSTQSIQNRVLDTRYGLKSDSLRWQLFVTSMSIGLENPLLGVSPQELPFELARKLGEKNAYISPHNMYAHIAGGSGYVALFLLLHIGYMLATRKPQFPLDISSQIGFRHARSAMRMLLVLWFVRAAFTNEIIYSPGFCMAIGLALGLELSVESMGSRVRRLPSPTYAVEY